MYLSPASEESTYADRVKLNLQRSMPPMDDGSSFSRAASTWGRPIVTPSVAVTVAAAVAEAPGEPDAATDGEEAAVGTGVLPHGSAVEVGPEGPDAVADGEAPDTADDEAAAVDAGRGVGENVEDAPPHPSTRIATAMAARKTPRNVALERRLIDSPIG